MQLVIECRFASRVSAFLCISLALDRVLQILVQNVVESQNEMLVLTVFAVQTIDDQCCKMGINNVNYTSIANLVNNPKPSQGCRKSYNGFAFAKFVLDFSNTCKLKLPLVQFGCICYFHMLRFCKIERVESKRLHEYWRFECVIIIPNQLRYF